MYNSTPRSTSSGSAFAASSGKLHLRANQAFRRQKQVRRCKSIEEQIDHPNSCGAGSYKPRLMRRELNHERHPQVLNTVVTYIVAVIIVVLYLETRNKSYALFDSSRLCSCTRSHHLHARDRRPFASAVSSQGRYFSPATFLRVASTTLA